MSHIILDVDLQIYPYICRTKSPYLISLYIILHPNHDHRIELLDGRRCQLLVILLSSYVTMEADESSNVIIKVARN